MIRILPLAIELILVIFCLIDCMQAEVHRIRNLPRWAWVLLMIFVPFVGCIAWLVAGRPVRGSLRDQLRQSSNAGQAEPGRPVRRPLAPDDDPEFLRSLKKRDKEQEDLLKKWEEDLKRREDDLRKKDQNPGPEET